MSKIRKSKKEIIKDRIKNRSIGKAIGKNRVSKEKPVNKTQSTPKYNIKNLPLASYTRSEFNIKTNDIEYKKPVIIKGKKNNMGRTFEERIVKMIDIRRNTVVHKSSKLIELERLRLQEAKKAQKKHVLKDFGKYNPEENVEFNVAICISSYNRYIKVKKIIDTLYSQETKYKFKIFLLNDGSIDKRYNNFNADKWNKLGLNYINNDINGGKQYYWRTVSTLWQSTKQYKYHALCQMDDDFVLCDNFIDRLMGTFYQEKENYNYMGFRYHIGDYNKISNPSYFFGLDGGSMFDINFIKFINYSINRITFNIRDTDHSHVWSFLSARMKIFGGLVYPLPKSLVKHDGNEDSKLNPVGRTNTKIITQQFIDNE